MNEINRWLNSGAEVQEGLRLLNIYAPNRHLARLVEASPDKFRYLLRRRLERFVSPDDAGQVRRRGNFREQWPFLSEPDCPPELKILAADKISSYWNYVEGHEELWHCTTPEECFMTAKKVVENLLQNYRIHAEFCNYRDRHVVLGKHPVFKRTERLEELRQMSAVELVAKKKNLEGAIWRINDEIKKGDKPHLLSAREARLKEKRIMLAEVERMIESYESQQNGRNRKRQ